MRQFCAPDKATDGRGANVVVDTLGFPALGQTVAACAPEARIGTLGALSGSAPDTGGATQRQLIGKNITIKGLASGSRAMLSAAMNIVAENDLKMVIDKTFAFADAPAAYAHLESYAHLGKVMITV